MGPRLQMARRESGDAIISSGAVTEMDRVLSRSALDFDCMFASIKVRRALFKSLDDTHNIIR